MSAEEFSKLKEEDKNQATLLYFGLRVLSDHVAFLIDTSQSMGEEYTPKKDSSETSGDEKERGKTVVVESKKKSGSKDKSKGNITTKLDIAKKELTQVVKGLKDGQELNILQFSSLIKDFVASVGLSATKTLAKLSPPMRQQIRVFIQDAKAGGLTNLFGAIKDASEYPELDTIYVLSDGAPTYGVTDHQEVLAEVNRLNRRLRIKINAISFDPKPDERKLLRALADQNYGVYIER